MARFRPNSPTQSPSRTLSGLKYWKELQNLSGMLFGVFVGVHLYNLALGLFGGEEYDTFQETAAGWYQLPWMEVANLVTLCVHVVSSLTLYFKGSSLPRSRSLRSQLHRLTGFVLLFLIGGHVMFTRVLPYFYGIRVGFSGVAFTFQNNFLLFFPYYLVYASAGAYHLLNALFINIAPATTGASGLFGLWNKAFWTIFLALEAVFVAALLSLSGFNYPIQDHSNSPYAQMQRQMGMI
ncbi:MAG: hypothetical protein Q8P67_02235 [archaeon]|nr:hypothetical protein [archaeon]